MAQEWRLQASPPFKIGNIDVSVSLKFSKNRSFYGISGILLQNSALNNHVRTLENGNSTHHQSIVPAEKHFPKNLSTRSSDDPLCVNAQPVHNLCRTERCSITLSHSSVLQGCRATSWRLGCRTLILGKCRAYICPCLVACYAGLSRLHYCMLSYTGPGTGR